MEGEGWEERNGVDSRQVRNSTGAPRHGSQVQEGFSMGLESYRTQYPRRDIAGRVGWGGTETKTARAARGPSGAGQAHAQVTRCSSRPSTPMGTPEQQGRTLPWWAA